MGILILLVVLIGAILTGGTAVMEEEDVVKFSLFGAAGASVAVVILAGIFWVLGRFVDYDLSQISF